MQRGKCNNDSELCAWNDERWAQVVPTVHIEMQPKRLNKEGRSFAKGNCRYIYSHHFTCFCHSTELALFILDGPSAPLESNKLEERRPNRNRCVKFVTER